MWRRQLLSVALVLSLLVHLAVCAPSTTSDATDAAAEKKTSSNSRASNPPKQEQQQQVADEEQQLEKLKASTAAKGVSVLKSQKQTMTNINGKVESVSEKHEKVQDPATGRTVAQVSQETVQSQAGPNSKPDTVSHTVVDVPGRGVHKATVTHNGRRIESRSGGGSRSGSSGSSKEMNNEDYYQPLEGIQYTPADMAEYIYRTGDEDGVTLAIEELIREGLLSQDEAISYLEEVKMDLEMLKAQDERETRMRAVAARRAAMMASQESQEEKALEQARLRERAATRMAMRGQRLLAESDESGEEMKQHHQLPSRVHFPRQDIDSNNKRKPESSYRRNKGSLYDERDKDEMMSPSSASASGGSGAASDADVADYEDMLERLRLADFISKELSLEEVIYQLAKQMFAQSVIKGNSDAEEALKRFTTFLQQESARGRISPDLQRKVIDVMLAALVDTVGEHPELAAMQPGPVMMTNNNNKQQQQADNIVQGGGMKGNNLLSKQQLLKSKTTNSEQLTEGKEFHPHQENKQPDSSLKTAAAKKKTA